MKHWNHFLITQLPFIAHTESLQTNVYHKKQKKKNVYKNLKVL